MHRGLAIAVCVLVGSLLLASLRSLGDGHTGGTGAPPTTAGGVGNTLMQIGTKHAQVTASLARRKSGSAPESLACHGCHSSRGTCTRVDAADKPADITETDFNDASCSQCDDENLDWPCGSEICFCRWAATDYAGDSGTVKCMPEFAAYPKVQRYAAAAEVLPGLLPPHVDTSDERNNRPNVRRVIEALKVNSTTPEVAWEGLFAKRNALYTYEAFLQAVAKFPPFCGQAADGMDELEACKHTLAICFGHFAQETGLRDPNDADVPEEWRQGLHLTAEGNGNAGHESCTTDPAPHVCHDYNVNCDEEREDGIHCRTCADVSDASTCENHDEDTGGTSLYFGRGAKQLSWNYNYAAFSKALFGDPLILLDNPERVAAEAFLALASGIWFASTTQSPKPSMLDVANGLWSPNTHDTDQGIKKGFGATINIINGDVECGAHATADDDCSEPGGDCAKLMQGKRAEFYKHFMEDFFKLSVLYNKLYEDEDKDGSLTCEEMEDFPADGDGNPLLHFELSWAESSCEVEIVTYATNYPVTGGVSAYNELLKDIKAGTVHDKTVDCSSEADYQVVLCYSANVVDECSDDDAGYYCSMEGTNPFEGPTCAKLGCTACKENHNCGWFKTENCKCLGKWWDGYNATCLAVDYASASACFDYDGGSLCKLQCSSD